MASPTTLLLVFLLLYPVTIYAQHDNNDPAKPGPGTDNNGPPAKPGSGPTPNNKKTTTTKQPIIPTAESEGTTTTGSGDTDSTDKPVKNPPCNFGFKHMVVAGFVGFGLILGT
jgi:hypothetical protein